MNNQPKTEKSFIIPTIIIIVIVAVAAVGVWYSLRAEPTPACINTCESDFCDGFNKYNCQIQSNGCKAPVDQGKIVGQCDVVTLPTDCKEGTKFTAYNKACETEQTLPVKNTKPSPKTEKPEPAKVAFKETCGNSIADFGESCATCPTDVICPEWNSCMFGECKEYGLLPQGGSNYCGYTEGSFKTNEGYNLNFIAEKGAESCVPDYAPDHNGIKMADKKVGKSDQMWECINKYGLTLPQWAAIALDKERIINRIKVLQSNVGHDAYNVEKVSIWTSADSTDGKDGHWVRVGGETLRDTYEDWVNVFFPPITATWIKVQVDSAYNQDRIAIGEIKIYEAPYICDNDYNRYGDLR